MPVLGATNQAQILPEGFVSGPVLVCSNTNEVAEKPAAVKTGPFKRNDGLDGPRNYLAEVRLRAFDTNKLSRSEREVLKTGIPHNRQIHDGHVFFERRSKREFGMFASLLRCSTASFPQVVKDLAEHYGDSTEDEVAWYLVTKLLLMKKQVEVTATSGELPE